MFLRFHSRYRENYLRVLCQIFRNAFLAVYSLQQYVRTRKKSISIEVTTEVRPFLSKKSYFSMKEICFYFQDRFNWLALLHIRKDMNMHIDKAVDMFAAMHPRRMRMTNFLGED